VKHYDRAEIYSSYLKLLGFAADSFLLPSAEFTYGEQRLVLKVNEKILRRIKQDIRETIRKYGNLSPEYFAHIRNLSIKYWYELDRTKIFSEE